MYYNWDDFASNYLVQEEETKLDRKQNLVKNKNSNELSLALKAIKDAGLYIAQQEDLEKLAESAKNSYEGYPLHDWFAGGTYDGEITKQIIHISLKTMIDEGIVYADSEEINGFAIWLPPEYPGVKTLSFLFNGGIKLICYAGLGIVDRLLSYENYAVKIKENNSSKEDWYLYHLSVEKDKQGQGIATKLLKPMLEVLHREGKGCYLETNKKENVGLYEHYGFTLKEEGKVPKSDIKHYVMRIE